jgi:phenylacetate-coenzyme A ligase PaaK-like adenylate-forming protein
LPAIKVQGRSDDVLSVAARSGAVVKLMPLALATVLEDDARVNDFQLLQTGTRHLVLRLGRADRVHAETARSALNAYLKRLGLAGVRVDLDPALPRREVCSGKLRRVVNALRPAPAG